jgi:hypothetical protein
VIVASYLLSIARVKRAGGVWIEIEITVPGHRKPSKKHMDTPEKSWFPKISANRNAPRYKATAENWQLVNHADLGKIKKKELHVYGANGRGMRLSIKLPTKTGSRAAEADTIYSIQVGTTDTSEASGREDGPFGWSSYLLPSSEITHIMCS